MLYKTSKGKMKPSEEKVIRKHYKEIREEVDADDIVHDLFSDYVISLDQKDEIMKRETKKKQTEALLDTLLRAGPGNAFAVFVSALSLKYSHIAEKMEVKPDENELVLKSIPVDENLQIGPQNGIKFLININCKKCRHEVAAVQEVLKIPSQLAMRNRSETINGESVLVQHFKNPFGYEFDVVTVKCLTTQLKISEEKVAEHTWFSGFTWSIIRCSKCEGHLGWQYHAMKEAEILRTFVGFIKENVSYDDNTQNVTALRLGGKTSICFNNCIISHLKLCLVPVH